MEPCVAHTVNLFTGFVLVCFFEMVGYYRVLCLIFKINLKLHIKGRHVMASINVAHRQNCVWQGYRVSRRVLTDCTKTGSSLSPLLIVGL